MQRFTFTEWLYDESIRTDRWQGLSSQSEGVVHFHPEKEIQRTSD